jgi:hypothetical protein
MVLVAVLSVAASLATRYGTTCPADFGSATSVSSHSVSAKAQHLLGDGAQWTAPTSGFLMLVVPHRTSRTLRIVVPITALYFETWLYNRPPPSC